MVITAVIKHVHYVRGRLADGTTRWYIYAWRGGPHVASYDGRKKPTLDPEALQTVASLVAERFAPTPDTLLALGRKWRSLDPGRPSSPEWDRLAATTKKTWGSALDRIEEKWSNVPLAIFNDTRMIQKVIDWRDSRIATPRAADLGIDVLKALLKYGCQRGMLKMNVASGIGKIYQGGQRAEIIWTEDDLLRFSEAAAAMGHEHVDDAVQLDAVTGLRREDLATLTWSSISDFAIIKRAKKQSRGLRRFATMPRIPALDAVLERLKDRDRRPGVETVLVTKSGDPWNLDALSKAVAAVRKKAGIIHVDEETGRKRTKHLHDVRGSYATRLMTTTDLTDQEIAEIMGWSPEEVGRIRKVYVDQSARVVAIGRRIARGL